MALTAPSALPADAMGRRASKLRIQLNDACNLRCVYCMTEDATFTPHSELLSPAELGDLCAALRSFGLDEARITGGEPTIRPDFLDCVRAISSVGWNRLGLTTNGLRLAELAHPLADLGFQGANVSLDSLTEDGFRRIARRDGLAKVLAGIDAARDAGLLVKINCVLMRGNNEHELLDFVRFSASEGIEVRFLEAMRVGPLALSAGEPLIPSAELRSRIEAAFGRPTPQAVAKDATAQVVAYPNGARIGFVSSETEPFCGDCSRVRLSARGKLRSCLFRAEGPSLRHLSGNALLEAVIAELRTKPSGRIPSQSEGMNSIGG